MNGVSSSTLDAPLLRASGLSKTYGRGPGATQALKDVSLSVRKGEYISIVGASGSGKSTLLAILGLLETHDAGHYEVVGVDIRTASRRALASTRNQHFGFVFQSFNLLPDMTVLDNVALPLRIRGTARSESSERAKAALSRVGLGGRGSSMPAQLSGGQQQRVAIARALVGNPDVILADEATGNLDSDNSTAVMDLFEELHSSGSTLLFVTHDMTLARRATRSLIMKDGSIVDS